MHTHAKVEQSTLDNFLTLSPRPFTSGSMHAKCKGHLYPEVKGQGLGTKGHGDY